MCLVRLDLAGCLTERKDVSQDSRVSGVQYHVTYKICSATNILAEFHSESGFNGAHRLAQHEDDIKHKRKKNAMAKHLDTFHPEDVGDADSFNSSSVQTFKNRLQRQISEGVSILKTNAEVSKDRQNRMNQ